jgi:acyl-CoA hydrolase
MAKADSIDILEPVQLGEIVDIRAKVVFHGQSSMTILVDVASGDSVTRQAPPRMRGRFMMVAVDAGGLPIPIPDGTGQFR